METSPVKNKILHALEHKIHHAIIVNRRYLDDEQLLCSEQLEVLEEIFNANVRDVEIRELTDHFAPIFRDDHPVHLTLWGQTGTGKTLTLRFFLGLVEKMCQKKHIPIRVVHLDLSIPRPCFRALNNLACLLNACKYYKKGISLDELMHRIEDALADYHGYLVIFIDEVDNVRTDKQTFLSCLIRRLPQRIPSKLILVFASNRINWMDDMDPRVRSFFKFNELVFKPYDAMDLQHILKVRVKKALNPHFLEPGVVERIAALACQDHGDARQAVALLSRSAHLAEKAGRKITQQIVIQSAEEIESDKYTDMIRHAPLQLQAVMAAAILLTRNDPVKRHDTMDIYDTYRQFCQQVKLRPVATRAFRELVNELDLYTFVRSRIISRGRYGRTRQLELDLPQEIIRRIEQAIWANFDIAKSFKD